MPFVLVYLGYYKKYHRVVYKQQEFSFHGSAGWESQDQGAIRFLVHGLFLIVSSRGGNVRPLSEVPFVRTLILSLRAPSL